MLHKKWPLCFIRDNAATSCCNHWLDDVRGLISGSHEKNPDPNRPFSMFFLSFSDFLFQHFHTFTLTLAHFSRILSHKTFFCKFFAKFFWPTKKHKKLKISIPFFLHGNRKIFHILIHFLVTTTWRCIAPYKTKRPPFYATYQAVSLSRPCAIPPTR